MGGITFEASDVTEVVRVVPYMLPGGRTVVVDAAAASVRPALALRYEVAEPWQEGDSA